MTESTWEKFKREQFPTLLAAAQHQDQINSWPFWARWLHRRFISWRCPACQAWKERVK